MPAHDLPLLIDAARIAGRIATSFTGRHAQRWDKPDGAGPVTEADLAVNDHLRSTLCLARPDYGWLSEESEDSVHRLNHDRVFIVDPIDGTRSFVEGSNTWAHSIAVAERGEVTAAVVYLPLRDRLYAAAKGKGAWLNDAPLRCAPARPLSKTTILAAKPVLDGQNWQSGTAPAFGRSYRPSLAYRLALVGAGRFDGMLTLRRTWEWDIAAGALIVTEAGGQIGDRKGGTLRFNNADPCLNGVVAASPQVHHGLTTALA